MPPDPPLHATLPSLRVLLVVEQSGDAGAAGGRYHRGILTELDGVEVHLVNLAASTPFREAVQDVCAGVHELDLSGSYLRALPTLRRLLRRLAPQLLHAHEFIPAGYAAMASLGLSSRPALVYSRHHSRTLSGMARALEGVALRRAAAVACPSRWALEELRRRAPGIGGRGVVLHNGIDLEAPPGGGAAADPAWEAVRTPFQGATAVILARLRPEKGHAVALEAVVRLNRGGTPCRLVCVGDGPERAALEARVKELGASTYVTFPGGTRRVDRILGAADLVLVPSLQESFGLAAAEAMLAGVPVVASRVGGLPEVVEDGRTGWLVPPGDVPEWEATLRRVLEMRAEVRKGVVAVARADAEARFTSRAAAERLRGLYREVAASRPRS